MLRFHARSLVTQTYGPAESRELREAAVVLTNGGLPHAVNESMGRTWLDAFFQWAIAEQAERQDGLNGTYSLHDLPHVLTLHHPGITKAEIVEEVRQRAAHRLPIIAVQEVRWPVQPVPCRIRLCSHVPTVLSQALPSHFPYVADGEFDDVVQEAWFAGKLAIGGKTARAGGRTQRHLHGCAQHRVPSAAARVASWRSRALEEFAYNHSLPVLRFWEQTVSRAEDHPTPALSDLAGSRSPWRPYVPPGARASSDSKLDCRHCDHTWAPT